MKFCNNLYDGAKQARTSPFISYGLEELRANRTSLVSSLMTELRLSWFPILILKCTVCLRTSHWIIPKLLNGEKTLVCNRGIKQLLEKRQKERKRKDMKNSTKPTRPITNVRTGQSCLDEVHRFLPSSQQLHTDTVLPSSEMWLHSFLFLFIKEIKCSCQYVSQCPNSMDF